jgi:glucose/mannose-6-phosphate isomerase
MIDLNDQAAIKAADPQNMLGHIVNLPKQLEDGWTAADKIDLPKGFKSVDRVVIAGMGGSAIGGSLLASLLATECKHPIFVSRNYELPAFANGSTTLLIASSNSGNTEETLTALKQARARGCQILAMTTGGELANLARQAGLPLITINYQSQPRAALGWSFAPLLNLTSRLGWTHNLKEDMDEAASVMREWRMELGAESALMNNLAKREAGQLMGRIPFVLGAGYFAEVARRWKDQFNENAKAWAVFEELPEADHNMLVGTDWPETFASKVMALFLTGSQEHPRNARRIELTRKNLMMAGCNTDLMTARGKSPLAQMMSLIHLGDFMSFYLALLNGAEPTQVDGLAQFKQEMAEE